MMGGPGRFGDILNQETLKPRSLGSTLRRLGAYFGQFCPSLVLAFILIVASTWTQVTNARSDGTGNRLLPGLARRKPNGRSGRGSSWRSGPPEMRKLELWDADEGTAETFPEIESLPEGCRFSACRHGAEPDCAVRGGVDEGTLDLARVEAFRRLVRELAYLDRKDDPKAQAAERSRWRAIHKSLRSHPKYKPK